MTWFVVIENLLPESMGMNGFTLSEIEYVDVGQPEVFQILFQLEVALLQLGDGSPQIGTPRIMGTFDQSLKKPLHVRMLFLNLVQLGAERLNHLFNSRLLVDQKVTLSYGGDL